ncbi:MAG: hypothetical protein L6Q46_04875 [Flavobacterium sp.]|uniref:hypothetical protein n=1 Tax=Flavobacterium sp. TaxID=239 RepID=UPI0025BC99BB|nr:hypothetical protein [Flavobacterium sp.]MCK6607624.1 hypothetical protein [Flavobacterium sp.]
MKNKLFKIFSSTVLLITVFFFSCEKNEVNIDEHSHVDKNKISFKEFLNKTQIKDFNFQINTNTTSNQSIANRQSSDFIAFVVDTTLVKQRIQTSGNYTFTLPVIPVPYQNTESLFYNIVFYKSNNVWQWSILEYEKTQNTEYEFSVQEIVNDFNHNGLVNMRLQGVWSTTTTFNCVGCTGTCDLCHLCVSTTTTYELAILDDPTTQFEIIEDYGNGNPSLGAGGSINEVLANILSSEELIWWNGASQEQKQPILDYLNPNINNGESWLFVKEAIKTLKNGGEVDFENQIISDPEFKDSQLDCIHKQLKEIPNSLYSIMLAEFNDNTGSTLTFKIGTTPAGDWGITKGNNTLVNHYTITIAQNVENGSNLMKTVTLCHELIHAYMFNSLEKANYIIFDNSGAPFFNSNLCNTSTNYQNIDLNTLNTADRLLVLLCGMQQAGTLHGEQWSHEIFNTATFDIVTYRQALENFILANHDWDNESPIFKTRAMNVFGNRWKQKVAQATSWIGLEETADYQNYINSHSSNILQKLYLEVFKSIEILDAKSTCL